MPLEVAEASERHASDPTLAVEHKLDAERLQRALSALEPPQREVVALRFMGELSVHEVAAVLDKTEAAVKALQHRGLAALRRALAQD
jgi:RNA polymerase sigma-70 factor (ECF subfamily)